VRALQVATDGTVTKFQ